MDGSEKNVIFNRAEYQCSYKLHDVVIFVLRSLGVNYVYTSLIVSIEQHFTVGQFVAPEAHC